MPAGREPRQHSSAPTRWPPVADWKKPCARSSAVMHDPMRVYSDHYKLASTGASADVRTLAAARAAVPPEVWQDVAATAVSQLGRKGDVWTPARFLSDYGKLSPDGRRVLFSSVGSGQIVPFLNDIAEVSDRFVQAGKMANTSGTAGHVAAYTIITSLVGGIGTAFFTGNLAALAPPAIAIAGVFGNNGMARILATPATAASMARWARVYTGWPSGRRHRVSLHSSASPANWPTRSTERSAPKFRRRTSCDRPCRARAQAKPAQIRKIFHGQ